MKTINYLWADNGQPIYSQCFSVEEANKHRKRKLMAGRRHYYLYEENLKSDVLSLQQANIPFSANEEEHLIFIDDIYQPFMLKQELLRALKTDKGYSLYLNGSLYLNDKTCTTNNTKPLTCPDLAERVIARFMDHNPDKDWYVVNHH